MKSGHRLWKAVNEIWEKYSYLSEPLAGPAQNTPLLSDSDPACRLRHSNASAVHSTPVPLAKEITLYDWAEDMPQSVLDAFTEEYGVKVNYLVYESQEEAIANMKAGKIYDVVVMESRFIPQLVRENLLAELDQKKPG